MIIQELIPIKEQLERIEKKLDERFPSKLLNIKQVSEFVSISQSTIRRAVEKGELKCSRRLGKLLFQESDVRRWVNG
jgi:excisionase family DNA binding protein